MSASDSHDMKQHVRLYLMVFGALAVLTVVTVAVSYLHLSVAPAVVLALMIATVKASLVAMFFMHLKGERKWVTYVLVLTAFFFVVLMFVPLSTFLDHIGSRP